MHSKPENIKCSDIATIDTILDKTGLPFCSHWIPKSQNIVLYTSTCRLKAYAFFDFPVNILKTKWHCSHSSEWSIEETERVTFINSKKEVCSVTNLSFEEEDLLKSVDKHIDKTRNRTVTIGRGAFIDNFTISDKKESIIENKNEHLTNRKSLTSTTTSSNNKSRINCPGYYHNNCFHTSHVGLPLGSVISLKSRKRPTQFQPPKMYVVFPARGIQHNNPAYPSYHTQASGENGHSEITPSFSSMPYRQYGDVGNRTEPAHVPSFETRNYGQARGTNLAPFNNNQAVGATNMSNETTAVIRGNESATMSATLTSSAQRQTMPPASHPDYREHYTRLLSFTNWPGYARQDPTHLCKAGFFYTGNADLVRCFQCGIGLKDFRPDDVPLVEHVRYSCDCNFLLELLGPGLLAEYKRNVLGGNTNPNTFQQQQPLKEQPHQHQVTYGRANYQYNGLSTQTPQPIQQPAQQHQVTTPYGQSPHLGPSDFRSTAINHTSVTNQHYTTATSYQELQQPGQHGPIPPNTAAGVTYRHPEYASLDTRLASFAKWPPGIMQTSRQIAEAGFYYTGMSDVVRCWACDGGLQKWDPQDDPWIEHCFYFPTCPYAIQQKGSEYIALVQQQARGNKMNEGHHNIATTNSSVSQNGSSSSGINDDFHKMTIEEHEPVLLTVAAQSLLEMGYDDKKIKLAIEKLTRQGTTNPTAEQIVDIIEEGVENIPTNDTYQSNEMHRSTSEVLHENERLKSLLLCMACNENNVNVLFLPCTHHRMCTICAKTVTHCPLCNRFIQEKVKTYMS